KDGLRYSLQFFDASGTAIHKVYLRRESDVDAYHAIVSDFRAARQTPGEAVVPPAAEEPELPDERIDREGLNAAWAAMTDTHEFFGLLRKFKVKRTQAMRLAEPRFARALRVAGV